MNLLPNELIVQIASHLCYHDIISLFTALNYDTTSLNHFLKCIILVHTSRNQDSDQNVKTKTNLKRKYYHIIQDNIYSSTEDYINKKGVFRDELVKFESRSKKNKRYIQNLFLLYDFKFNGQNVKTLFKIMHELMYDPDHIDDTKDLKKSDRQFLTRFRNELIRIYSVTDLAMAISKYNESNLNLEFIKHNIGRYIDVIVKMDTYIDME